MSVKVFTVTFWIFLGSTVHGQLGNFRKSQNHFQQTLPQINLSLPIPTTVNQTASPQFLSHQSEFHNDNDDTKADKDPVTAESVKYSESDERSRISAVELDGIREQKHPTIDLKKPTAGETAEFLLPSASTEYVPIVMEYRVPENQQQNGISNRVDRPLVLPNDNVVRTDIQEAIRTGELSARDYLKAVPRMKYSDVLAEENLLIRNNQN